MGNIETIAERLLSGNIAIYERVMSAVQTNYNVDREQLLAPTRSNQKVAWARQVAVHLCHRIVPDASWTALGNYFGRDRTTVRHAHEKVSEVRGSGEDLDQLLEKLERECATSAIRADQHLDRSQSQ